MISLHSETISDGRYFIFVLDSMTFSHKIGIGNSFVVFINFFILSPIEQIFAFIIDLFLYDFFIWLKILFSDDASTLLFNENKKVYIACQLTQFERVWGLNENEEKMC